jgi:hypothetical protein
MPVFDEGTLPLPGRQPKQNACSLDYWTYLMKPIAERSERREPRAPKLATTLTPTKTRTTLLATGTWFEAPVA